jgi:predicted nucleic acid-binding protein
LVLDNSVALAWCFETERTPVLEALLRQVGAHGAIAPTIWPLEAANGLIMAERRGRLDATSRRELTDFLRRLPIVLDDETQERAWTNATQLALLHGLTIYDSAYLELAIRRGLPLATLDRDLHRAGKLVGLELLGL